MKFIDQFGKLPSGKRLARVKQSPNYKNGGFQNLSVTHTLTEGATYYGVIKAMFTPPEDIRPAGELPSVKTDLLNLNPTEDVLVWFGHSSYFIQLDGKRILVDPVFSGYASPIASYGQAFKGADIYTPDDIPAIDYLFISHDHWDHLDYHTITSLRPKIKKVICGLGIGAHFEHWGYSADSIIEKDWNEEEVLDNGFVVHTIPARHFSGRSITRNQGLWLSFALRTPTFNIFIGGDSGYDTHFATAGQQYGPFDLAILENGQYDKTWKNIHLLPEEVLVAAKDLRAKRVLPVHFGKFVLANHGWSEPVRLITEYSAAANIPVLTPMIGERVNLKDTNQKFKRWWEI